MSVLARRPPVRDASMVAGKRALGGFSFEPPPTWEDTSIAVYEAPEMGTAGSKVTVSWLPREAGVSLRKHVTTWAQSLKGTLDGVQFTELAPVLVDGCEALRTSMTWKGPSGAMAGAAVHVDQPAIAKKVLTLTCMCTSANQASSIPAFDKLVASGRFEGGGSRVPRSPAGPGEIDSLFVPMPGRGR
jgi:hypothetical protein